MEAIHKNIGQNFIVGIPENEPSDEYLDFITEYNIGGVLFLGRNYPSFEMFIDTVNKLQSAAAVHPLFTCVDHEGGRVQRFTEPFTRLPSYRELIKDRTAKEIFEIFMLISRELLACGINFNLAPVTDMTDGTDGAIGDRSIGTDLEKVDAAISSSIRGFIKGGMLCCAKHFPGHGCVTVDSHIELPKSDKTMEELLNYEILPFKKATKSGVSSIMTAHILFEKIDSLPASLSKAFITEIIRKEFRFIKLILTDDISMGAIKKNYSTIDATSLAIKAGSDMVIHSSPDINELSNLIDDTVRLSERDLELKNQLKASYSRIAEMKKNIAFKSIDPNSALDILSKSELKGLFT